MQLFPIPIILPRIKYLVAYLSLQLWPGIGLSIVTK